jgi:hypothetical protein
LQVSLNYATTFLASSLLRIGLGIVQGEIRLDFLRVKRIEPDDIRATANQEWAVRLASESPVFAPRLTLARWTGNERSSSITADFARSTASLAGS